MTTDKETNEQDVVQDVVDEEVIMESTESQIIETGFIAQQTEEESVEKSKKTRRCSKKQEIDSEILKIAVALLAILLFAFIAFQELDSVASKYLVTQQHQTNSQADKIASTISRRISLLQQKIVKKQFPSMENGEEINTDDIFAGSKVSYLSLPLKSTEIVDNPAQGYAFLALLDNLYTSTKRISSLEVIQPNSKYSAIILAKKSILKTKSTNQQQQTEVLGFYICTLTEQYLTQLLEGIDLAGGTIELTQGTGSSIKLANKGLIINKPISKIQSIANSQWKINYSVAVKVYDTEPTSYLLFMLYIVFVLIACIYFLFLLKNKIKALKKSTKKEKTSSVLDDKNSISKLGMQKTSALVDVTKTPKLDKEKMPPPPPQKTPETETAKIDPVILTDYGIRGLFGEQINAPVFNCIGHAIAQEMENRDLSKLTIGYDGRSSSEELYHALLAGLKAYELEIIDLGLVTLPVVYYCAQNQTQGNALMVTAGSSSAPYNGLKILLNNEIYTQAKLKILVDIVPEQGQSLCKIEKKNLNHTYINSLSESFNLQKKLTVVVDFANSVSSQIVFDLFKILDCQLIPLFEELDGTFPNHSPHPGKAENLQALAEKVKSESADLGLTFNGDGSALGMVSSKGDIIWADRILMLLAKDLLQQNPGAKVMYDVKSTSGLHEWIIQHQGEPELSPSGYSHIKQRMAANNAKLAGEFSGHLFFSEHANGLDDAFYVAAKLLQIISAYTGTSADLFKEIPDKISTPEVLIAVQPGQREEIIQKIIAQKNEFMPAAIITLDGLRVEYEDGWGVVRQSQTTSSLSLRFEADSPQVLQRIAEKFKEVILSVVFVKFPY